MTGFNPLASVTLCNIFSNFPLHSGPPKILTMVLVHFGAAWVNRKLGQMGFIKNLLSETMVFWNYDAILEP
jgi:hypothetical protein